MAWEWTSLFVWKKSSHEFWASPCIYISVPVTYELMSYTLRPRQNDRHFANVTFKRLFLNEIVRISIKISLKLVPKGPINSIPALVQITAWRRPGEEPLSEPMMDILPTHICGTRTQWVKHSVCNYKCGQRRECDVMWSTIYYQSGVYHIWERSTSQQCQSREGETHCNPSLGNKTVFHAFFLAALRSVSGKGSDGYETTRFSHL